MTIRIIIAILLLSGLFACNSSQDKKQSDQNTITIEDRVLYPKTVLSPLFDSLRPATQTYTIKGDRDTLLVGQNGTTFTILKNTFVNSEGQPAKTISIDLVEVNSIADIIKTNLQTTSGDKILQTGGMFFINAKENNKPLEVAEGKSIYVEVKSNYKDPQMKIFNGKFDNKGKIDWATTGNLENNLIPIPLSLVNFHKCDYECGFSKKQTDDLLNPKFENTYIATREFEDRCCAMSYATCPQSNNLSQKFLDIYIANINKPLYYSDSLVIDYLAKNLNDKIDTTKKFTWDDNGWYSYMFQFFIELKNQRLTNTINFDKLGITESTTTEELVSKGYSEREAEKFIAFFKVRKQIVKSREAEKQTSQLASYSFSINKLGWVNVDRFIDDNNTEPSTFLVQIKSKDTLDFISVSLVIPGYRVAVFSIHNDGNLYSFTKKNDGYRKLPVGQDAIIVAFSYKDNKPYFGKQKIKIPKDGQIDLALTASTEQIIKQDISKLTE
jgi:hypothetical protein